MTALKEIMEGKPFRAPVHPALVHLPIALLPLATLLDVGSWIVARAEVPLVPAAFICLVAGILTALVAAVFGLVDFTDIRDDHPAKKTATTHLLMNLVVVGLFAASAGLRYGQLGEAKTPLTPFIVSIVALIGLAYSGYLGGVLVYDDGIGVGRHRRKTRTPESTVTVPTNADPLAVCADSALGEGETARVDLGGTIATVVRLDGQVHAFQEFCTHRYGPLSEGSFSGCEVTCPWHRSRFDVTTGKVVAGPAKVDLRTFPVEVRDGTIWIQRPEPRQ
jgi:nitrite reductase/ring-hydroxylating ferredoxin subunit/uncharacterized membrane protein